MSSIAVVNAGSSSIKFAVFQTASTPSLLFRGQIEGIGTTPKAKLLDPRGNPLVEERFNDKGFDHAAATQAMLRIAATSRLWDTALFTAAPSILRRCC
jgi:acetate kinase